MSTGWRLATSLPNTNNLLLDGTPGFQVPYIFLYATCQMNISGIREAFMSGDHEPWVFRGGLAADLQRLMPVDSGNDLFLYQYPESPVSEVFHIRPFRPEDEEECYRVCLQTWDDGMDASQDFASHPTLVGEKSIGPLLTFYPGLGFVFENNEGQIVGYIFSAPCLTTYRQKVRHAWLPQLKDKYPPVEQGEGELLTT